MNLGGRVWTPDFLAGLVTTITCLWDGAASSAPVCACVGGDITQSASKAAALIPGRRDHIRTSSASHMKSTKDATPSYQRFSEAAFFWRHDTAHSGYQIPRTVPEAIFLPHGQRKLWVNTFWSLRWDGCGSSDF